MLDAFDFIWRDIDLLRQALLVMIELNVASIALALVLGVAIGIARHYGGPVLFYGLGFVVDVLRSIPLLVIIVWTFFALPFFFDLPTLPPLLAGIVALGIHSAAYFSEIVRGGLGSIRAGQMNACTALGMSNYQAIRRIILPQALIRGLPAIGTRIIKNIKDSVLTSTIAVKELFWAATLLENELARPFLVYTSLMLVYFIVNMAISTNVDRAYERLAIRGRS